MLLFFLLTLMMEQLKVDWNHKTDDINVKKTFFFTISGDRQRSTVVYDRVFFKADFVVLRGNGLGLRFCALSIVSYWVHQVIGFYWVLLGFYGFWWVLVGSSGFCWLWNSYYRVLLSFTRFYWVFLGFAKFIRFSLVLMSFNWVLLGFIRFY